MARDRVRRRGYCATGAGAGSTTGPTWRVDDLPDLQRWMAVIAWRPGCAKGLHDPYETNYNDPDADGAGIFVKDVQAILVR